MGNSSRRHLLSEENKKRRARFPERACTAKFVEVLLRALIDPRADKANFFGRQRFRGDGGGTSTLTAGGASAAFGMRRGVAGFWCFTGFFTSTGRSGSASSGARTARLGGHSGLAVDTCDGDHNAALGAVASNENFAIFAALQDAFEGVEAEAALGTLFAMATAAGGVEQRLDVSGEGNALFGRSGR